MTIEVTGDLLRGAKAKGIDQPIPFSAQAMHAAMNANPGVSKFRVYVNQFGEFIAQKVIKDVRVKASFEVLPDPKYAKDSWRIEPVED